LRLGEMQRRRRLFEKARLRNWQLAAERLRPQLTLALRSLNEAACDMSVRWFERPPQIPSLADLMAELEHLETEFGDLTLGDRNAFLAIETEAIVLEGIELGRFGLKLNCLRLAATIDLECFEIIPLDPNPAANDQNVPHPHVRSHRLCAGDATIPLQKALEQGRLVDAFCLLRSVLETYNAESAYTALKDWNGVSCWNCSYVADGDDVYFCEGCEHDVCQECTSNCEQCDRVFCSSCQTRCDECEAPCCLRCLKTSECSEMGCCAKCLKECPICGTKVASSELDDATERCPTCCEDETAVELAPPTNHASNPIQSP